jgi:hypothetical protein
VIVAISIFDHASSPKSECVGLQTADSFPSKDYASSRGEADSVVYQGNIGRRWDFLWSGLTKWGQG